MSAERAPRSSKKEYPPALSEQETRALVSGYIEKHNLIDRVVRTHEALKKGVIQSREISHFARNNPFVAEEKRIAHLRTTLEELLEGRVPRTKSIFDVLFHDVTYHTANDKYNFTKRKGHHAWRYYKHGDRVTEEGVMAMMDTINGLTNSTLFGETWTVEKGAWVQTTEEKEAAKEAAQKKKKRTPKVIDISAPVNGADEPREPFEAQEATDWEAYPFGKLPEQGAEEEQMRAEAEARMRRRAEALAERRSRDEQTGARVFDLDEPAYENVKVKERLKADSAEEKRRERFFRKYESRPYVPGPDATTRAESAIEVFVEGSGTLAELEPIVYDYLRAFYARAEHTEEGRYKIYYGTQLVLHKAEQERAIRIPEPRTRPAFPLHEENLEPQLSAGQGKQRGEMEAAKRAHRKRVDIETQKQRREKQRRHRRIMLGLVAGLAIDAGIYAAAKWGENVLVSPSFERVDADRGRQDRESTSDTFYVPMTPADPGFWELPEDERPPVVSISEASREAPESSERARSQGSTEEVVESDEAPAETYIIPSGTNQNQLQQEFEEQIEEELGGPYIEDERSQ